MSVSQEQEPASVGTDEGIVLDDQAIEQDWTLLLRQAFGVSFTLLDGPTGDVIHESSDQPVRDWGLRAEICRAVARGGRPEFLDDEDPVLTLALPLSDAADNTVVAVAHFLTRRVEPGEDLSSQAEVLGVESEQLAAWAVRQTAWTVESLRRVSDLVRHGVQTGHRVRELQEEADALSHNLASTYEEISLLYRLTQNLKISRSDEDFARIALEWLQGVVPAQGMAIQLVPTPNAEKSSSRTVRRQSVLLTRGDCPIDNERFSQWIAQLGSDSRHRPVVMNRSVTSRADWPLPEVHEAVVVGLAEGKNVFGWLAALNHADGGEFGTVEASLLGSVATILGIHGGNIELYRQQSELLAGIVRALTSAIDAKDPYTCGHSDRVARVAVRLAEALGCDDDTLNTLYLAGLLHDIGKIGVSDSVLRKAGALSDEEYQYIKQHVTIGHRILNDLAKLEDVLPVVLHHNESWNGDGYPSRLGCEGIPRSARIVAVADAYDAMSSDRPYRKGMPDEQVDRILREGAGRQWDPEVIAAYFRVRDEVRRISRSDEPLRISEVAGATR
ncbi:MAG: HD-GYP domain-containing protein [Thermoguttaceae bacterium]